MKLEIGLGPGPVESFGEYHRGRLEPGGYMAFGLLKGEQFAENNTGEITANQPADDKYGRLV